MSGYHVAVTMTEDKLEVHVWLGDMDPQLYMGTVQLEARHGVGDGFDMCANPLMERMLDKLRGLLSEEATAKLAAGLWTFDLWAGKGDDAWRWQDAAMAVVAQASRCRRAWGSAAAEARDRRGWNGRLMRGLVVDPDDLGEGEPMFPRGDAPGKP